MPRLKLTATNVGHLAPEPGRRSTDYRDTLLPGLVLRVTPKGVRTWAVEYHDGGGEARRGRRSTLGRFPRIGLADARDMALGRLTRIEKGLHPDAAAVAPVTTVAKLVQKAIDEGSIKPKTKHEWERLLKANIQPTIGDLRATDLTRADVRSWQRDLVKTKSGWISNRAFELLRWAYNWSRREEILQASPCDFVPKVFVEASSERVLSADELRALIAALEERRRPNSEALAGPRADSVWLLLYTGVRETAVLEARRDEVQGLDTTNPVWIVPAERSKRKLGDTRPQLVPMSDQAVSVWKRRLADVGESSQYLFPCAAPRKRKGDVPMTWESKWVEDLKLEVEVQLQVDLRNPEAAVPRWTIHNLRHTIGTHMSEDLDVDDSVVSLILGHTRKGARATRVYNRAEKLPKRRAALVAWAAWLDRLRTEAGARVLPFRA